MPKKSNRSLEPTSLGKPRSAAQLQRYGSRMIRLRSTFVFFSIAYAHCCQAQSGEQPWMQMLQLVGYSASAKAGFAQGCLKENPLSQTKAYLEICPKLSTIPAAVIEMAILPFARKHVTESQARDAIAFYVSPLGSNLKVKILREIETGKYDQLSQADLQQMDAANKLPFGRALKSLSMDQEGTIAVAKAMLRYEP